MLLNYRSSSHWTGPKHLAYPLLMIKTFLVIINSIFTVKPGIGLRYTRLIHSFISHAFSGASNYYQLNLSSFLLPTSHYTNLLLLVLYGYDYGTFFRTHCLYSFIQFCVMIIIIIIISYFVQKP